MTNCQVQWLGQVEYGTVWKLQKELVAKRAAGRIPNTMLLLEHPHTYTVGKDGHREHLLLDQDELCRLNVAYYQVDRGGGVTYHGPGQLVAYLILDLKDYRYRYTYHQYIKMLETMIIQTLSCFKVHGFRDRGQPGVWAMPNTSGSYRATSDNHAGKIAMIGVKINQEMITSHGLFININPDLHYFEPIMPGDVQDRHTTSLKELLDRPLEINCVVRPMLQSFYEIFKMEPLMYKSSPLEKVML